MGLVELPEDLKLQDKLKTVLASVSFISIVRIYSFSSLLASLPVILNRPTRHSHNPTLGKTYYKEGREEFWTQDWITFWFHMSH